METFYVTKKVRCKLKEEDQCFEVGDYNVGFYWDPYLGKGKEYYGLKIEKFIGDTVIADKWLYVLKENQNTYPNAWEKLHDELVLSQLIRKAKNSKVIL